jgi:drug/metabolite transporter (DMT)-like permease
MKHRGMARTAPFGYLEPLFAASLAVAVLGDTVTAPQLGGALLVLVGVVLAASGEVREAPPDATEDIAATIRP